jgi:hypothetical protein
MGCLLRRPALKPYDEFTPGPVAGLRAAAQYGALIN